MVKSNNNSFGFIALAQEGIINKLIKEVNEIVHEEYSNYDAFVGGIRFRLNEYPLKAIAVIDHASPRRVIIPSSITVNEVSYEVLALYVRSNTLEGTVIDIADHAIRLRFEGYVRKITLRANRLQESFSKDELPCSFTRFRNRILKAPDLCTEECHDGNVYVTETMNDSVIGIPIKDIIDIKSQKLEVYSGEMSGSLIEFDPTSVLNIRDGVLLVYEDRETILNKINVFSKPSF